MLKPRIELQTSKENDTHVKINIPQGCPFLCVKILKGIMKDMGMGKPPSEEILKSHKYEDWQGKNETYHSREATANIIYQQYAIHLIATDKTKQGQQKLTQALSEHFKIVM